MVKAGKRNDPFVLIAVDFETTGIRAKDHAITEIAGVRFTMGGEIQDSFASLADPGRKIPSEVSKITGITNSMVKGMKTSLEVMKEFENWAGPGANLVAHNAGFEAQFILETYKRGRATLPEWRIIDTLAWAKRVMPGRNNYKLGTLLKEIRASAKGLHRAEADAMGVVALVEHMASTMKSPIPAAKRRLRTIQEMTLSTKTRTKRGAGQSSGAATAKQLWYLRKLGASKREIAGIDKKDASALIEKYKAGEEVSSGLSFGCVVAIIVLAVLLWVIF